MMPDSLTVATEGLRDAAVPPGPSADLIWAAERIGARPVVRHRWIARLSGAAAALLAIAATGYLLAQRSATLVFADVVRMVGRTHSIEATITFGPVTGHLWLRGDQLRMEQTALGRTGVQVIDLGSGAKLSLDPATHVARVDHGPASTYDVYGWFAGLHGQNDGKPFGRKAIGGRLAEGFKVTGKIPNSPDLPLDVWVDPRTRLPLEIDATVGLLTATFHDIHFDQPLDDRLFSMTPPNGYRLAESRTTRYGGRVTDGQGKPLAGVDVYLNTLLYQIHSQAGAGGSAPNAKTDADGRFSISSADPPDADGSDVNAPKVRLQFRRSDLLYAHLEDVHLLSPEQRVDLRVQLRHGASLSGRVVDPAGQPVGGVRVRSIFGLSRDDPETRYEYLKWATTDAAGHFELRGLAPGKAAIGAMVLGPNEVIRCGQVSVDLGQPVASVTVTVRPLELPPGTVVYKIFGMRLTDVTPELKSTLLLNEPRGVLVLSPGPNARRLLPLPSTLPLQPGSEIWMANNVRIDGCQDLVHQLANAVANRRDFTTAILGPQLVYNAAGYQDEGSMTTYADLTAADRAELARAAAPTTRP